METNSSSATADRTKCEIWTRVMGYHRPVSQYNFGKKSEFYSRVYFKATCEANSSFVHQYGGCLKESSTLPAKPKLLLFTTNTCPKCPAVKNWLDSSGIEFFGIDNTMLNFWDIADKYNVRSVPTLIAVDENGKEIWRANEVSEIQQKNVQ
jgi:ribonucleoside-triphosphate reductase